MHLLTYIKEPCYSDKHTIVIQINVHWEKYWIEIHTFSLKENVSEDSFALYPIVGNNCVVRQTCLWRVR